MTNSAISACRRNALGLMALWLASCAGDEPANGTGRGAAAASSEPGATSAGPSSSNAGADGSTGDPLKSIDTGTDPVFPVGDVRLVVDGMNLSVSAPRPVQTAAGIYDANGTLVRTLWRRRVVSPEAIVTASWDGKDDFGADVDDGAYRIKVVAHNVAYKWQGVIGNTSNPGANGVVQRSVAMDGTTVQIDTVPETVHRSFLPLSSVAIGPTGRAYVALGYNEQQPGMGRFELAAPQTRVSLSKDDFQRSFELVTTDGSIAYFANTGVHGSGIFDHPENFIVGVRATDDQEVTFASGSAWTDGIGPQNHWNSVIDVVADGRDAIRGLAVDPSGPNLYVAHAQSGIRIFDKTSGACKNCGSEIAVPSPSALAVAPNGDLWVVSQRTEVRQYTSPGSAPTQALTIGGLSKATAIAVSPITATLVVVDAGATEQQLKAFSTATGAVAWVHGKKGGYSTANGPDVTVTKLNFGDGDIHTVAFEPGPKEILWVGEPGNQRNLKLELPPNPAAVDPLSYVDQIMYTPNSYCTAVDKGNPTRVFNGYLEFAVDYSKPLTQSWTLVRNWDTRLPSHYRDRLSAGFRDVYTTPQGRTYATVLTSRAPGRSELGNMLVELTSAGVRDTGIRFDFGERLSDGLSVRRARESGSRYEIVQRDVASIDGDGNPVYTAERVVASAPLLGANGKQNPYHGPCAVDAQEPTFGQTSSGLFVTFDPCAFANGAYDPGGMHLGGIASGGTDYRFRASPGGSFGLQHDVFIVDGDGAFNLDRLQQNYAASVAMTAGRQVVYNYFGEFWNNGQANQWMHFLDDGLFIGQFGTPNYPGLSKLAPVVGAAGNTFTPVMVVVDGNFYVYHNDESAHAGVHRWRLANMASLQEMVGTIGKNVAVENPPTIASTAVSPY